MIRQALMCGAVLLPLATAMQQPAPIAATSVGSGPEIQALADSLARQQIADGLTAGLSVAVVRGSDTLVWKGWGRANLELDVPATPETVYRVASLTKQFTAALVLKLAAAGTLSVDDPVGRWVELPDAWRSAERPITLRHLLSHTSGIPSFTDADGFDRHARLDLTHEEVLDLVRTDSLLFAPGTSFSYSNTGYELLGRVIEQATGRRFEAVLEDSLIAPLGLDRTRYCWEAPLIEDRADGYTRSDSVPGLGALDGPRLVNAPPISMRVPFAGGALCSTVADLMEWTRALYGGTVIPDRLLARMTTETRLLNGWGAGYGFGLGVSDLAGHRRVAHEGNIGGFRALLSYYPEGPGPDDDLTIAVLMNSDAGQPDIVALTLARAALDIPAPDVADRVVPARLATRLTGPYVYLRRGTRYDVSVRDGRLYVRPPGGRPVRLFYQGIRQTDQGTAAVFRPAFAPTAVRIDFLLPEDPAADSRVHVVRTYRLTWFTRPHDAGG